MAKSKKNKEITCEGACNSCVYETDCGGHRKEKDSITQKDLDIFAGLYPDEIEKACDLYARAHGVGKYYGKDPTKIKPIDPKAKRVADKYDKEHLNDPDANEDDWVLHFSKHQMRLAEIWMAEHRKHCPACKKHDEARKAGFSPLGGWCEFSYEILPTTFVTLASIKCNECGDEYYLDEV